MCEGLDDIYRKVLTGQGRRQDSPRHRAEPGGKTAAVTGQGRAQYMRENGSRRSSNANGKRAHQKPGYIDAPETDICSVRCRAHCSIVDIPNRFL